MHGAEALTAATFVFPPQNSLSPLDMTASEVGLDFDREESGSRHPRPETNVRRGPEIQDYTPF